MTGRRADAGGGALPGRLEIEGRAVEIKRAWPKADGTQTFEAIDEAGRIRAGRWKNASATLLPHAVDPKLPALSGEGVLVVHRYGRRAVVRRDAPAGPAYLKILRPGRAAAVAGVSRRLGHVATAAGFLAPEVVGEEDGLVCFSAVRGLPLAGLPRAVWNSAWDAWAESWPRLVSSQVAGLPAHDAASESSVLATWAGHLLRHDPLRLTPAARALLESRVAAATEALEATGPGRTVVAHRDLHDKQLLFDAVAGRLGMLDFDTAALADVELDLGNLLAHLDLRRDQGVVGAADRDAAMAAVRATAGALGAGQDRLDAYTEAARIRLVCVYAFRPAWRGLAAEWLAAQPAPTGR